MALEVRLRLQYTLSLCVIMQLQVMVGGWCDSCNGSTVQKDKLPMDGKAFLDQIDEQAADRSIDLSRLPGLGLAMDTGQSRELSLMRDMPKFSEQLRRLDSEPEPEPGSDDDDDDDDDEAGPTLTGSQSMAIFASVGGAGVLIFVIMAYYYTCCRLRPQHGHLIFLSHYKKEAAVEATLLHTEIKSRLQSKKYRQKPRFREPIFLDSENLNDLATLTRAVENTWNLVVILSPGVLQRPWCLLEIVTAYRSNTNMVPMTISAYYPFPDEDWYACLRNGGAFAPETLEFLNEHGVELEEVEMALRFMFKKICASFNAQKSTHVREAEIDCILEKCCWPDIRRSGIRYTAKHKGAGGGSDTLTTGMATEDRSYYASAPWRKARCLPSHQLYMFITQTDTVMCRSCQARFAEGSKVFLCMQCKLELCEQCSLQRFTEEQGTGSKSMGAASSQVNDAPSLLLAAKIQEAIPCASTMAVDNFHHDEVQLVTAAEIVAINTIGAMQDSARMQGIGPQLEEGPGSPPAGVCGITCAPCGPDQRSTDVRIVNHDNSV